MIIINLTYLVPLEEVDRYRETHLGFLKKYYEESIFVASGPKNPREGGIILARGRTKPEIETIIQEDPFYTNGIAAYEVTEFKPTMYEETFFFSEESH